MTAGLLPGLCSVTFRELPPAQVLDLAVGAGLAVVEWGGDVHVPPGDEATAARVGSATRAAGLAVCSYGSYLFADDGLDAATVERVLDTAEALGAPWLRVWCPVGLEPGGDPSRRDAVVRALATISAAAAARSVSVYLEFHGGTLTATAASARSLLDEVDAPNLWTAWQPPYWAPLDLADEVGAIGALAPRVAHVHVYSWGPDGARHPLAAEAGRWPERLAAVTAAGAASDAAPRAALLEFLPGDDPDLLVTEAASLRRWLGDGA